MFSYQLVARICKPGWLKISFPLTQYWTFDDDFCNLLHQFSDSESENLAPRCRFENICLCMSFMRKR